jgi:hypothetical protein
VVTGFAQKSITLSHRRVAGGYTVAGKSTLDSGSGTRGLTNSWLCTEVASKLGTYKHVRVDKLAAAIATEVADSKVHTPYDRTSRTIPRAPTHQKRLD